MKQPLSYESVKQSGRIRRRAVFNTPDTVPHDTASRDDDSSSEEDESEDLDEEIFELNSHQASQNSTVS